MPKQRTSYPHQALAQRETMPPAHAAQSPAGHQAARRVVNSPLVVQPATLLELQRTMGNRAVQRQLANQTLQQSVPAVPVIRREPTPDAPVDEVNGVPRGWPTSSTTRPASQAPVIAVQRTPQKFGKKAQVPEEIAPYFLEYCPNWRNILVHIDKYKVLSNSDYGGRQASLTVLKNACEDWKKSHQEDAKLSPTNEKRFLFLMSLFNAISTEQCEIDAVLNPSIISHGPKKDKTGAASNLDQEAGAIVDIKDITLVEQRQDFALMAGEQHGHQEINEVKLDAHKTLAPTSSSFTYNKIALTSKHVSAILSDLQNLSWENMKKADVIRDFQEKNTQSTSMSVKKWFGQNNLQKKDMQSFIELVEPKTKPARKQKLPLSSSLSKDRASDSARGRQEAPQHANSEADAPRRWKTSQFKYLYLADGGTKVISVLQNRDDKAMRSEYKYLLKIGDQGLPIPNPELICFNDQVAIKMDKVEGNLIDIAKIMPIAFYNAVILTISGKNIDTSELGLVNLQRQNPQVKDTNKEALQIVKKGLEKIIQVKDVLSILDLQIILKQDGTFAIIDPLWAGASESSDLSDGSLQIVNDTYERVVNMVKILEGQMSLPKL